jgi:hypothetical protein
LRHAYSYDALEDEIRAVSLRIDPSLERLAAQTLVDWVLSASFRPKSFQFTGRGLAPAIAEVKKAIADGCIYVAAIEIEDLYECFDLEMMVARLPLPRSVVENEF